MIGEARTGMATIIHHQPRQTCNKKESGKRCYKQRAVH